MEELERRDVDRVREDNSEDAVRDKGGGDTSLTDVSESMP